MTLLADAKMYARFASGLRGFLRHTISLDEAQAIVRQRLADREANFLRLVERGIFGYARSPYLPLLKLAHCQFGDIQDMVRTKGLEDTLRALREAGVYVTFEEFKGYEPIVRHGQVIPAEAHSFDNPFLSHYYRTRSGGTTGAGTRVDTDLDHLAAMAPLLMLAYSAYGVVDAPLAFWFSILPAGAGINGVLRQAKLGQVPGKWFTPIGPDNVRPALKNRLATWYIILLGRLSGVSMPWPEPVTPDQAVVIARWASEMVRSHGRCLVRAYVSAALRVSLAAQDAGLDLTGVTFVGGGEPPTPAKVRGITRSGAWWVPTYWFAEAGLMGIGCARPADENDLHLFRDVVALIQCPREVPGFGITVDSFHFTSLLPSTPKLMLNVESDDYGVIEQRSCGCPLEAYGFTEHLRHIRSFRKLTGEGVTLVGSEMVRILEEVLPARFGGSPLDYQLAEEEDERGFTRLNLLISPRVHICDEAAVVEAVLGALGQSSVSADLTRARWSQVGALRVRREEPRWTARGKLMPLHMGQRPGHRR